MTHSLFGIWVSGMSLVLIITYFVSPLIGSIAGLILQGILMFVIDKNNEYLEYQIRLSQPPKKYDPFAWQHGQHLNDTRSNLRL